MKHRTAPTKPMEQNARYPDLICVVLLLLATVGIYSPSLFGGRVLLPADIVPLMRPWGMHIEEKFPDYHHAQNQMHGPIFEYYSWRHYARERIRAGEVPLWNPYELGGNVLLANSQSAVLYPPNALLFILPLHVGINLVTALHTFLTGLFLYVLMRWWRLVPAAALTSAFVWMFCGVQMAWLEFQTPTAALCWLPGLILAWEAFARGRGTTYVLLGGSACIALTLLAGHLHFAFYVIMAICVYAFGRTIGPAAFRRQPRRAVSASAALFAAIGLGVGISSATMVPVVEMAKMNFRASKTDYASSIGLRLPPENLLTLAQPNVFGSPRHYIKVDTSGRSADGNSYFGSFDYIEYSCYLGIPGLILALYGASGVLKRAHSSPSHGSRKAPAIFLGLALLGLLLALGTPVCAILFYGVPGYGQFNATARALCLFCFGFSALVGIGVQRLLVRFADQPADTRPFWHAVGLVVLMGLAAFPGLAVVHRHLLSDGWLPYESANLRHFAVFAGLTALVGWLILHKSDGVRTKWRVWIVPLIAIADLLIIYAGFNPQTEPAMLGFATGTTNFLHQAGIARVVSLKKSEMGIKGFIVPNFNATFGLREVQGADSLHSRRFHRLMERVVMSMDPGRGAPFTDPNTVHVPGISHPIFDLLNTRFVTTAPNEPNPDPARLVPVHRAELDIWENSKAMGPAWIVGSAETVDGLDGFLARVSEPSFDPRSTALITSPTPRLHPLAASSPTKLVSFSPHRIEIETAPRHNGLLIVSEMAFPGWRAEVDGREVSVLTADYLFRAVPVGPDDRRVVMSYRPASYQIGLYLTCVSLAALSGLACCRRRAL